MPEHFRRTDTHARRVHKDSRARAPDLPINPIDYFVQQRMAEHDLQPAPRSEPAVLLRRLSLDLVGLLPTSEHVVAFEQEPSDRNYEAAIDPLLQSKHFGEQWALH